MENKKIAWIIVSVVIILAVAFYFLNFFGIFKGTVSPLALYPITPICTNSSCEVSYPYTCPSYDKGEQVTQCPITAKLECSQGGIQPKVKFRTNVQNSIWNTDNGIDSNKAWISYSIGASLVPYTFSQKIPLEINNFNTLKTNLKSSVTYQGGLNGVSDLYIQSGIVYITKNELAPKSLLPIIQTRRCTVTGLANGCNNPNLKDYSVECETCGVGIQQCSARELDCGYFNEFRDGQYYYQFIQDTTFADTTSTKTEPYNSHGLEIIEGSGNTYNCQGYFEIYNINNILRYGPSLSIPGENPWNKSDSQVIYPGEKATFNQVGQGGIGHLYAGTEKDVEGCALGNKPVCLPVDSFGNSNGYYNCENGVLNKGNITYCRTDLSEICKDSMCQIPLQTKTIIINNGKTGVNKDEPITVDVLLIAKPGTTLANVHNARVRLDWYKIDSGISKSNMEKNIDLTSGSTVRYNMDNPGSDGDLGLYYLVVSINYDDSKPPIMLGLETPKNYLISIGASVSCSIQLQTSITDIQTSKLLTNIPIFIKLNTIVGTSGSQVDTRNVTVSIKQGSIEKSKIILGPPSSEGASAGAYTYTYNYLTNIPGDIYVTASISSSGVPANCNSPSGLKVEDMTIRTNFYDIGGNCLPPGEHIFYFETYDSLNRRADTINSLCVKKPGSGTHCETINNLIQPGDGTIGRYKFNYDLIKSGGETANYAFLLTTHSNEFGRDYAVPDLNIEVKDSCVPTECVTTLDCQNKYGANYICNTSTGKCVDANPPYWLWLGIGIGILVLIIIIILIIKFVRNKSSRQDFYTGL